MRKHIALTAAALAAATLSTSGAQAADYTMKIGIATFKDVQHQWSSWMKEEIEKKTNGRIAVNIFPKSQLGAIPRQIDGVRLGTQQAFVAPTDFFSGIDPRFGVFSIPILFKDKLHAAKVIADPDLNKEILTLGGDKGIENAAIFTHSTAHYLAKNPIRKLGDFKGKKFRVNATAAEREKMRRFGASAVPMPLSEVVPALQRGVVDGTQSGTVVYVVFKFNRISKVLTRTDDTLIISAAALSKAWLKQLPADLRKIVVDTSRSLQVKSSEFSHKSENFMLSKWKESGGSLITLPADDLAKIRSMLGDVGETVTKGNPQVHALFKRIKEVGKKY
jgi:TRAP-type transport system periplasmic protein